MEQKRTNDEIFSTMISKNQILNVNCLNNIEIERFKSNKY